METVYTINNTDIVIGDRIASGRFGNIHAALCVNRENNTKMKVTVKRSKKGNLVKEASILKFIRSQRGHPNILKYFLLIDKYTFVTKYYPGKFTSKCAELRLNDDVGGLLKLAKGILEGLDFLAKHNIVHNDIKPANIVLDRHGNSVIVDFGFAESGSIFMDKSQRGTPYYMSPEKLSKNKYNCSSDMYSFGIMFWEMITGIGAYSDIKVISELEDFVSKNRPPTLGNSFLDEICEKAWSLTERSTPRELIDFIESQEDVHPAY